MQKVQICGLSLWISLLLLCLPVLSIGADTKELQLTPEEQSWLASHQKIVVGGETDWAPFDFVDGATGYAGIANDYLQIIGEKLGLEIEVITGPPWSELLSMARRKEIDVLPALYHSTDREEFLRFTEPYLALPEFVFTRSDDPTISEFTDLQNKTTVVVKGYTIEDVLQSQYPHYKVITVSTIQDALAKIVIGEADAYIGDLISTSYHINELTLPGIKPRSTVPFKAQTIHMAVRKDWPVLQKLIDKVFNTIPTTKKNAIKNQWVNRVEEKAPAANTNKIRFTEEEHAWLEAHPIIRVQNETTSPPFNFAEHNRPKGFSIDYMRLLAEKIGFSIQFITGPSWDEFLTMMKSGELDVMLNIAKTPEREAYLSYTPPFVTLAQTLFTRKDFPLVTSITDLYGKRIAVPKGFHIAELLKEYPEVEVVEVRDIVESMRAVSVGQADALYDIMPAVNYLMDKHLMTNLKVGGELGIGAGRPMPLHLAVPKKDSILASILSKGMAEITDEEFQVLSDKWLNRLQAEASVLDLTPEERIWLKEHPVIRVINDKTFPPYDFFKGGKPQGFSVEYLELLSDLAGFTIEWQSTDDWNSAVNDVKNKRVDALHGVAMTEERLAYMLFSTPYFKNLTGLFVRWNTHGVSSIEDFAESTLAIPKGYSDAAYVRETCPGCTIIETENPSAALQAVAHDQAKAAVLDSGVGNYLIAEQGLSNLRLSNYLFLGEEGQQDAFMVGVRNDWPELVGILDKAIASVPQDELLHLRRQWLLEEAPKPAAAVVDHVSYMQILKYGLTALLLLLLLALVVLKFIKAERVSEIFGSKRFRTYVFVGLVMFIMIVIVMGWLALGSIRQKVLSNTESSLRGGLKIADYALEYWARDRKNMLKQLGQNPVLMEATERLLQVPPQRETLLSAPALRDARKFFENDPGVFDNIGFFIISPDYISIGSRRDTNIGTRNLIADQRPDLIRRAFEGELLFVPPIRSDVHLGKTEVTKSPEMPPTMFFMGPIENKNGDIIAVFTVRVDPTKGLTESLQVAGDTYSQETYAFNKNGVLLTNSRFEAQLLQIGLLEEGQSSSMQLVLKDPGVNLVKGENPLIARAERPLTFMAERAIASRNESRGSKLDSAALVIDMDVEGYRDYRGVPVFGAWLWDMNLDVGVAVEIDVEEAMSNYIYVRNILFVVLGLTLMLSTGVTILVLVLGQRTSKLLASAKDTLEDTVQERTAELTAAEEHSRLILSSMGEGLIEVNTAGQATFVNASALLMLGYTEEELLGHSIHDRIHHSHPDGSPFDIRDCPMNKSFTDGVRHTINDEVLWRKDGTSVPVEYSATPMIRHGSVVGAVIVFQDVSERIKAAHEVQTTKDQLQEILDKSPIAVAFSTGGVIHFTNPSFEAQFGVKVGDQSPDLYVHPTERDDIIAMMQRDGQVSNHEIQMFNKDNQIRDMLISYIPITYEEEEGILGWLLDITERKQAEREILESEAKFRFLFDGVSIPLCYVREDGTIAEINPKLTELFGYTLEDISTIDHWFEHAYPDPQYRQRAYESWSAAVENAHREGTEIKAAEYQLTCKSGAVKSVMIAGSVFEGSLLVTFIDITGRKEMEAALFRERDRLDEMMNTSPVGVAITVNGVFRFTNRNWSQLTGLKEGDTPEGLYVDPESRKAMIDALVKHGRLENYEVKLYDRNREIRDMLVTFYAFDYENEPGVLGWTVDVTDMKKIEKELRDKFNDLERFRKLAVGRELKMIELKQEINDLLEKSDGTTKYKIH